jgi:creatinine amidohydrolase
VIAGSPDLAFGAVRYELLLPRELRAALAARPVAYVPLGTCEWHGEHLPVGLDGLTAHGVCLRAAVADGGVVLPPLYYGTGGGHSAYPWTIMMPSEREIASLLLGAMSRLADFGFKMAVLLSGHFAPSQIDMIQRLAADWQAAGHDMRILPIGMNMIGGLALEPDHAALFETTLLGELWPAGVAIERLAALVGGPDADSWSPRRHDPDHPLYGIFGPDPRAYDSVRGPKVLAQAVSWVTAAVRALGADVLPAGAALQAPPGS